MPGRTRIIDWRPLHRNTLRGFARVAFPSGLIVAEVAVHQAGSKVWAQPPGRPMLDRDGAALRADDGKIRYAPIVAFANHGTRAGWSRQVITALREAYPDALEPAESGATA